MRIPLAALLLAASVAAQKCQLAMRGHENPKLVCAERGHATAAGKKNIVRQYTLPASGLSQTQHSLRKCARNCGQDISCFTVSYNLVSGQCTTYSAQFEPQGFRANKNSNTVFYDRKCLEFTSECLLANPSFENATSGTPTGNFKLGAQDIGVQPWSSMEPADGIGGFGALATPKDAPKNSRPAPNGVNFALLSVDSANYLFFGQFVNLFAQTTYEVQFDYSFISYRGKTEVSDSPNNSYEISACFEDLCVTSAVLNPGTTGAVDGVWHAANRGKMQFKTGKGRRGFVFGQLYIQVAPPRNGLEKRAVFGLDDVSLEQVTAV